MGKTVELVDCLSHHVQSKAKPTMTLLVISLKLSSNSVNKALFLKCYGDRKTYTENLSELIARSTRTVREIQDPQENRYGSVSETL